MTFSWEAEAADLSTIPGNRLTQRDLLQFALLARLQSPQDRCLVSRKPFVWDLCRPTRSTFEGDHGLSSFLISLPGPGVCGFVPLLLLPHYDELPY